MSSASLDTMNEGHGIHAWDYLPLSEPRIVMQLIRGRSRQDASYYPKQDAVSPTESAGVFPFNEAVICAYLSQDACIERAALSSLQSRIVALLMQGYTQQDIAELDGCALETVHTHLRRAVQRIVHANNEQWVNTMEQKQSRCALSQ